MNSIKISQSHVCLLLKIELKKRIVTISDGRDVNADGTTPLFISSTGESPRSRTEHTLI